MIENSELAATIGTIIFAVLATYAGSRWGAAKEKLHAVRVLVSDIDDALADNILSKEEIERIAWDLHEILGSPGAPAAG